MSTKAIRARAGALLPRILTLTDPRAPIPSRLQALNLILASLSAIIGKSPDLARTIIRTAWFAREYMKIIHGVELDMTPLETRRKKQPPLRPEETTDYDDDTPDPQTRRAYRWIIANTTRRPGENIFQYLERTGWFLTFILTHLGTFTLTEIMGQEAEEAEAHLPTFKL